MDRIKKISLIAFFILFFSCKYGSMGGLYGPTFAYVEILDEEHNILENVEFSAVSGGNVLKDFYVEIDKRYGINVIKDFGLEYGTYLYELCSESYVYSGDKDGKYVGNPDITVTASKAGYKSLTFVPYDDGSVFYKSYIMEKE